MAASFTYSILYVRDMSRSVAFYRDLIGLTVKLESPDWTEFDTAGCTFALHLAASIEPLPEPRPHAFPPGHSHPGFQVEDILDFARRMREAGVPCLSVPKLEDFGMRMGSWRDPDGIPVSVYSLG
jgi:lactoylglutathione lyase